MSGRIFLGIDLDINYASRMWNTYEPNSRRQLALKRKFRSECLRLEREMKAGMYVIDRDNRIYQIIEVKGWTIETKEYWLQRFTTHGIEKKTALDIYPLDWWTKEREGMVQAGERTPLWFQVVDAIKKKQEESND